MGTAVLFPGQGSQFVGMGGDLYDRSPAARAVFETADAQIGFPLSTLCFSGPEDKLTATEFQQPAIFTTNIAGWSAMISQNETAVDYLAGHSLGEFSALVAAGAINFSDGLNLVIKRGELMKLAGEREPGAMAAILALDVEVVKDLCRQASDNTGMTAQLANDNCPGQVVISGHDQALDEAMRLAAEAGARKVVKLPISIAAHSDLMASVAGEFAQTVDQTPIHQPKIPLVGNVSAAPLATVDDIRMEIKQQLTSSIAWTGSMRYLLAQNIQTFIEVGPGNVLLGLMKRIDRQVTRVKFE